MPADLRVARLRGAVVCHIPGDVELLDMVLYCCIRLPDFVLHFAWVLDHTDVSLW